MAKKQKKSLLRLDVNIGKIKLDEKAHFAKDLAIMLKSGMTLDQALKAIRQTADGKMKDITAKLGKAVESGQPFYQSLQRFPKVFSPFFIGSVYAGESSGTLGENLENIANQLHKEDELYSKIKSSMLYPSIILVAGFVMSLFISLYVLPKITPLFKGLRMDLPLSTKMLMAFSEFMQQHGTAVFVSVVGLLILLIWIVRQNFSHPVTHKLWLKIPVIGRITKNANLSRLCLTLGHLLKSGLPIDEALAVTKKTMTNYYYRQALADVEKSVSKGTKLSKNLKQQRGLFPLIGVRMISVGEQSGRLEETLIYLSEFYENKVDNAIKTLATVIEPVLLIAIGLLIGFLAISIITPIYSITGGISR